MFQGQHVVDQGAVVGEAVDPRHSQFEHPALHPGPVGERKLGQRAAVTVDLSPAIGQLQSLAESQLLQSVAGLLGQGPGLEAAPAERQLGRLDPDQAHFPSVIQFQSVAVDNGDGAGCLARLKRDRVGLLGALCGGPEQSRRQQGGDQVSEA